MIKRNTEDMGFRVKICVKDKRWKDEFVEWLPCLCLGELTVGGTQLSRPPVKLTMHCNDVEDDDDDDVDEKDDEEDVDGGSDGDYSIDLDGVDDIDFDNADNGVDDDNDKPGEQDIDLDVSGEDDYEWK